MENRELNSQESLEIITRMIAETRGKLESGGGTIFLIWGYTSLLVAAAVLLSVYLSQNYNWQWLWWSLPIIGYTLMHFALRNKPKPVKTYIDKFISYIWMTIGTVAIVVPIIGMFNQVANQMILPLEAILLAIGAILTGLTIRFKALVICGYISLALGFLMIFFPTCHVYIFMAMLAVGMVIPGHILNHKGRCLKS